MSVYTKRVVGPVALANSPLTQLLATVPAGKVWVLRTVIVANNSTSLATTVRLATGTAGVGANRWYKRLVPADETDIRDLRYAMIAGETIEGLHNDAAPATVSITAYEFDA